MTRRFLGRSRASAPRKLAEKSQTTFIATMVTSSCNAVPSVATGQFSGIDAENKLWSNKFPQFELALLAHGNLLPS